MEKITILIADDHKLVRQTWSDMINADRRFRVIAQCATGEQAIELAKQLRPAVIILDINLPGITGIETTEQIRKFSPGSKILGISIHRLPAIARGMIKKGARGYLTKNSSREEMFTAITEVYAGRKYLCTEITDIISLKSHETRRPASGISSLSAREIEIMMHIKNSLSSREIAGKFNISVKTVEVHRYNILKKLGLSNTASMVNFANAHLDFGL
jgi:two-component system invasion response regulator UvrY